MSDSLPEISRQLETLSARRRRMRHLAVLLEQGRKRLETARAELIESA